MPLGLRMLLHPDGCPLAAIFVQYDPTALTLAERAKGRNLTLAGLIKVSLPGIWNWDLICAICLGFPLEVRKPVSQSRVWVFAPFIAETGKKERWSRGSNTFKSALEGRERRQGTKRAGQWGKGEACPRPWITCPSLAPESNPLWALLPFLPEIPCDVSAVFKRHQLGVGIWPCYMFKEALFSRRWHVAASKNTRHWHGRGLLHLCLGSGLSMPTPTQTFSFEVPSLSWEGVSPLKRCQAGSSPHVHLACIWLQENCAFGRWGLVISQPLLSTVLYCYMQPSILSRGFLVAFLTRFEVRGSTSLHGEGRNDSTPKNSLYGNPLWNFQP